jgi:hypothetical protein
MLRRPALTKSVTGFASSDFAAKLSFRLSLVEHSTPSASGCIITCPFTMTHNRLEMLRRDGQNKVDILNRKESNMRKANLQKNNLILVTVMLAFLLHTYIIILIPLL